MKSRIVRIGNSRGIRIPQALLEQTGLSGEVDIQVDKETLIIKAARKPRANWSEAFARIATEGDDVLIDPEHATEWDKEDWQW